MTGVQTCALPISGATFENQIQAVRRLYQDAIIPQTENEDQYWTERLRLRDYGYELKTDFSHVPALAENLKEKATSLSYNTTSADKAYNNDIITWNQYLELIGMEAVEGGDVYKSERNGSTEADKGGNQTPPAAEEETV